MQTFFINFRDGYISMRHVEICFKVRSNYSDVTESSRYSKLYETGASARDGIILAGGLFGILLGFEVKRNGADEARHFLAKASALLPTSPDILFPHPFFSAVLPSSQYPVNVRLVIRKRRRSNFFSCVLKVYVNQ